MMFPFFLNFLVVLFSLLAGGFWLASALGRTISFQKPWTASQPVPPNDLPAHQSYYNARAALCASVAAIAQAILFLYTYYVI
jgi:hypothetical protein